MRLQPSLLLALPLLSACAAAPGAAPIELVRTADPVFATRLEHLAEQLEAARVQHHVPGMSIAVVSGDELVWARGFGLASIEDGEPATTETLYAVGSTTKAFTSALIARLVAQGRMSWDDPVTRWLPYFTPPVRGAGEDDVLTIRDLLCHRSGFTRMGILWASGRATREEILRTASGAEPWADFREQFLYNNVMYLAAGMAAAEAAGESWEEQVRRRLFDPLEMSDSNLSVAESRRDPRLARGYLWDPEAEDFELQEMRDLGAIAPAGAINSTVLDMAHWLRFQLAGGSYAGQRLVDEAVLRTTWEPQMEIAQGTEYGLGWFLLRWHGERVVSHGGNIDGFSAMVAMLPEEDLGFVLLTNASATPLQQLSVNMVWDALADPPDAVAEADAVAAGGEAAPATAAADPFDEYLGEYVADFGAFEDARFEVLVQNGRLAVDVPGQIVYELKEPDAEGKRGFALTDEIAVSFERNSRGVVQAMRMYQAGLAFDLPRVGVEIEPDIPLEDLTPYLGTYHDDLLSADVEVLIRDNRMAVDVPQQMAYLLQPPDEEGRWVFRATPDLAVEFVEQAGEVTGLIFHERGTTRACPRVAGPSGPLPTVDEVMALRAGTAAWERLLDEGSGVRMSGTVRMPQSGVAGSFVLLFAGRDRYRIDLDFKSFGETHSALDGDDAWTDSTFEPFHQLAGKYLEEARTSHPAAFFGDWRSWFDQVEVTGASVEGGRRLLEVRLVRGDLPPARARVDAETGDVVRVEARALHRLVGELPVRTRLEDYVEQDGLRYPRKTTRSNDATGDTVLTIESLETGVEVAPDTFAHE